MYKDLKEKYEQKNRELEEKNRELDRKDIALEQKLDTIQSGLTASVAEAVRDIPYVSVCAFKQGWMTANTTIAFDYITSRFTNADRPNGGDGELNIITGVYCVHLSDGGSLHHHLLWQRVDGRRGGCSV